MPPVNEMPTHRAVARVTLELTAPISIGTGTPGDFEDDVVVTDASGLPALPGSSLAGALRAAVTRSSGLTRAEDLFGYMGLGERDPSRPGARSRAHISWGALHDAKDQPVAPLLTPTQIEQDPVLANARSGLTRDHVRLDLFGVADGHGKFDRSSVPRGHRFTFELELEGDARVGVELDALLNLLAEVRLGGHTRSGLGTFQVVRVLKDTFELKTLADFQRYSARPLGLNEPWPALQPWRPGQRPAVPVERIRVTLRPEEPWLVGGVPQREEASGLKAPDVAPYREDHVVWTSVGRETKGVVQSGYCVPGSALKGALRHRVAFALRAAQGQFAHVVATSGGEAHTPPEPAGLEVLFGCINAERLWGESLRGQPGRLFIGEGEVKVNPKSRRSMHVSLDRFTGAPMNGRLFEDEALEGGEVHFELELRPPPADGPAMEDWQKARTALGQVLEDIERGLFQFGAGYGRGYGWYKGQVRIEKKSTQ